MSKHKSTKACDISPKVRQAVAERDSPNGYIQCIICGRNNAIPNAHFIPRDMLGLGIEENIVSLCSDCHRRYDQTTERERLGQIIKSYLQSKYDYWDEDMLVYKKGI